MALSRLRRFVARQSLVRYAVLTFAFLFVINLIVSLLLGFGQGWHGAFELFWFPTVGMVVCTVAMHVQRARASSSDS
jgi:hypothetical protein